MLIKELTERYKAAGRRYHIVGDELDGVILALDVEGRIFAFKDGVILNRVNEEAIAGISTRDNYINPGGDGFWPAPEGSTKGYEYPAGSWRVPPSLTNARYLVKKSTSNTALAEAEVDLVNSSGVGMPFIFSRDITVSSSAKELTVSITEGIEYIGTREIAKSEAVIAPWSLCQFDCGADCTLTLPKLPAGEVWDLYPWDSSCHRKETENGIEVEMVTDFRFQLGISPKANWLLFTDRGRGFSVRRSAAVLAEGLEYIPIGDGEPSQPADTRPCRFSAYCDPSGFMEIEAAGGTPAVLKPGVKTTLLVTNQYKVF